MTDLARVLPALLVLSCAEEEVCPLGSMRVDDRCQIATADAVYPPLKDALAADSETQQDLADAATGAAGDLGPDESDTEDSEEDATTTPDEDGSQGPSDIGEGPPEDASAQDAGPGGPAAESDR